MDVAPTFAVGFWHPFGRHGGECPDQIIRRKSREIQETGFTFWSFQVRPPETVNRWSSLIKDVVRDGPVWALCSLGRGARDPRSPVHRCTEYLNGSLDRWLPIPPTIEVPHPVGARRGYQACAFKVLEVQSFPAGMELNFKIEWWSFKEQQWLQRRLPTRPEILIRKAEGAHLRPISAALLLESPYVVYLRGEGKVHSAQDIEKIPTWEVNQDGIH